MESCLRHRCSQPMAIDFHLQEKQGRPLNPSQGGLCSTLLPLIPSEVYYLLFIVGMHAMHDVCMWVHALWHACEGHRCSIESVLSFCYILGITGHRLDGRHHSWLSHQDSLLLRFSHSSGSAL